MTEVEIGRSRPWVTYVVAAGAVLALVAGYVALAESHHRELRVVRDGAEVRVEQGRYAPFGWRPYRPTEAFKPVSIEADVAVRAGECADLADCEDRMFSVVVEQARRYLRRRERLREASELVAQAVKLSGSSNRSQLLEIQGDEQYVLALLKLRQAATVLTEARESFFRARAMETRAYGNADEMVRRVDAMLAELASLQPRPTQGPSLPSTSAPSAPPKPILIPPRPLPPSVEADAGPDAGVELKL